MSEHSGLRDGDCIPKRPRGLVSGFASSDRRGVVSPSTPHDLLAFIAAGAQVVVRKRAVDRASDPADPLERPSCSLHRNVHSRDTEASFVTSLTSSSLALVNNGNHAAAANALFASEYHDVAESREEYLQFPGLDALLNLCHRARPPGPLHAPSTSGRRAMDRRVVDR